MFIVHSVAEMGRLASLQHTEEEHGTNVIQVSQHVYLHLGLVASIPVVLYDNNKGVYQTDQNLCI